MVNALYVCKQPVAQVVYKQFVAQVLASVHGLFSHHYAYKLEVGEYMILQLLYYTSSNSL